MRNTRRLQVLCAWSVAVAAGCGDRLGPVPTDPPIPVAAESGTSDKAGDDEQNSQRDFDGIAFTIPEKWSETKLTGMRASILQAAFGVPEVSDELEVTFSSVGGGIDQNLQRWVAQFGGAAANKESLFVAGSKTTWVDMRGTFSAAVSGRPGQHANWRLLGAAFRRPPQDLYVKLTGPEQAVADVYDAFREMVTSASAD